MPTLEITARIVKRILEKFSEVDTVHDRSSDENSDGNRNKYNTRVYVPKSNSNYPISRIVSTDLFVERTGIQSTMIRVYGKEDNVLPHLAFDIFQNAPDCIHIQCDLINRIDLMVNLPYVRKYYEPLAHTLENMRLVDGAVTQPIPFFQRALVTGYFFGFSVSLDAIPPFEELVMQYLDHWFSLTDLPQQELLDAVDPRDNDKNKIKEYDVRVRRSLMEMEMVWKILPVLVDPETTKIWTQINLCEGDNFSVNGQITLDDE